MNEVMKIYHGQNYLNEDMWAHKCNQCEYTSSWASNLRTHLKIHSGEKSNKCKQCDFASFRAGDLRRHLTKHGGEK